MATASTRKITIGFTGEFGATVNYQAAENSDSPGNHEYVTLENGTNTITPPAGGTTPVAVTIIPPPGNIVAMILKGIAGDIGVRLHNTDPTSIGLHSPTNTFVITTGAEIIGVQFIWS